MSENNFTHICFVDFKEGIERNNGIVLDVRTSFEFEFGHIKSAKNIDIYLPSFLSKIEKLDKEKHYYVNCQSGSRSSEALRVMQELGFKNVYGLQGGISSWYYPMEKGA
ncbi:MAG: rhodanese-like domain-containing protein [bacterium]